jgi:AcrR family transcriptional regulator
VAAILDAAVEEISEKGYDALSIEAVAERAGVNKTTVYRRWSTKSELVTAALSQEEEALFADPETGSVAEDLLVLARRLRALLRTKRGRALYLIALQDRLAQGDLRGPGDAKRHGLAIVDRGVARGELPSGTDPELVTGTLFGVVILRSLFEKQPPTDDFLRQLVAFVLAGSRGTAEARAAPPRSAAPPPRRAPSPPPRARR